MFDIEIEITERRASSQPLAVPQPAFIYAALNPKSTILAAMQQYLLHAGVRMQHVEIFLMGVSSLLAGVNWRTQPSERVLSFIRITMQTRSSANRRDFKKKKERKRKIESVYITNSNGLLWRP